MRPLALALALVLAPVVQASIPMPALVVGASWDERTTQGGALLATQRTTVEAREAIDDIDTLRVASRMEFTPRQEGGITRGNSTVWLRDSDGALVKQRLDSFFGDEQGISIEYRWDPPCAQRPWPLDAGAKWEVNCTSTSSDGQRYPGLDRREAVREEDVSVPAGAFRALLVETRDVSDELTSREWIAPGVCAPVRSETIQASEAPIVREMTAQSCSGAKAATTPGLGVAAALAALALVAGARRASTPRAGFTQR